MGTCVVTFSFCSCENIANKLARESVLNNLVLMSETID